MTNDFYTPEIAGLNRLFFLDFGRFRADFDLICGPFFAVVPSPGDQPAIEILGLPLEIIQAVADRGERRLVVAAIDRDSPSRISESRWQQHLRELNPVQPNFNSLNYR